MNSINLEKYKSAWKNEPVFQEKGLTTKEVSRFMQSSSKNLIATFKRTLFFDIFLKSALFGSTIILFVLFADQQALLFIDIFVSVVIVSGIIFQLVILKKMPDKILESQSVLNKLRQIIAFYYRYFIHSIFTSALSSALLFYIGSLYYFYFKYSKIPQLEIDDFVVLGVFILINYGLSLFAQFKYNNFRIRQLEKNLKEIEEKSFTEESTRQYRTDRLRSTLMMSILVILGLLLLLYFGLQVGF